MDNIAAANADNAAPPSALAATADNVVQQSNQTVQHDHGHHTHSAHFEADVASAKMAWEAWKSNDPAQIDHALDEKQRICKVDPKAWKEAMKEVDADEAQAKRLAEMQAELQAEAAANAAKQGPPAPGFDANGNLAAQPAPDGQAPVTGDAQPLLPPPTAADGQVPAPADAPGQIVDATYPTQGDFAPPPPNTPAYNQAYHQPPERIFGINTPFLRLGINEHGSFAFGITTPIAGGDLVAGPFETRVKGEILPFSSAVHGRVNAGYTLDNRGLHGEAGAGANFFNIAGGDVDGGFHINQTAGVDGDARVTALGVHGQGDGGASIGANGLQVHGGGNADVLNAVGGRAGGRVVLGPNDTGFAAGAGAKVGDKTIDVGPQVDAYPDGTGTADLHIDPAAGNKAPFFPNGDRALDPQQ